MTNTPPHGLFWDGNAALPPFYLIKNCILIACALDKWDEADTYRATAEHAHNKALREAEETHDEDMIVMLGDLRSELDELEDFKREDIAMQALDPQHLSRYWHVDPNDDTSDYSQELKDEMQALIEIANELKEVAEAILLSNRVLMDAAEDADEAA
ncbi:hypothetical protein E8E13_007300 [Curvularia kusanoi]|uniref:Uncharacterized protein n=1 Tax=Curvularia kusanoi TaxID=90978 RepID=A0A9P4TLZ2_CURKU|nr:hypothetical protein E8E13_007300 [Curvularia kusanoi]